MTRRRRSTTPTFILVLLLSIALGWALGWVIAHHNVAASPGAESGVR